MNFWFTLSFFILLSFGLLACTPEVQPDLNTPELIIKPLGANTYQHTSFLTFEDFGPFPCNGVIYARNGEAIIFDTPLSDSLSLELIHWVERELEAKVIGIVPTHFHIDCTAGLPSFHKLKIPSYSHRSSCALSEEKFPDPGCAHHFFDDSLSILVGGQPVVLWYPGAGHTLDNTVAWIPEDKVLFGGCLIKSIGAQKGNLEDAKVTDWSPSVLRIKNHFPEVKVVVPGHGAAGGPDLLDYTYKLFMHE